MEPVTIESVFVGQPAEIGETRRGPVISAIAKHQVTAAELELTNLNLAGDRQADLTVHGGPDKAVYACAVEHQEQWQADGFEVVSGSLGENLATRGVTEVDVRIGDRWRWGTALLEVSQPRAPCYKRSVHAGRKDIGPHLIGNAWCGWYFRVVEPGVVPTTGTIGVVSVADGPTIDEAFRAMFDRDPHAARTVLAAPALADQWRMFLSQRLG